MLTYVKNTSWSGKFFGIISLLLANVGGINAQSLHKCGTQVTNTQIEYMDKHVRPLAQNYARFRTHALVYVPIKAHIIRTSSGTGGLSIADLVTAIEGMNNYYKNADISFYLYESINYIDNDTYYDFNSSDESAMGNAHDVSNVINVYFANSAKSGSSPVCGYAYFPGGKDRVIMSNDCATNGSTLPHELGHYFALYHTHGKTNNGTTDELVDGSNCSTTGDDVCDTPADPNVSGKVDGSCKYTGTEKDGNGQAYTPDANNIMSYSTKVCRNKFSQGQYDRISATLTNSRNYLLTKTTPPPTITSFTPTNGVGGAQVTITGTKFSTTPGNNIVTFNGAKAAVTSSTSTQLVLNVPATATSGLITVAVDKQLAVSSQSFLVPVNKFPYVESFETKTGDWTQATNDDFDWTNLSGNTSSANTGPGNAADGSSYLYTEASGSNNPTKSAVLNSLIFDLSGLPKPEFSFSYHMYGTGMGTLKLEVSKDNGGTWTTLWTKTGDQGDTWNSQNVDLSSYQSSSVQFRFVGTTGSSFASDMAIDYIQIKSTDNFYIGGFSPATAAVGETVTISGGGFSTVPANNQVKFNGVSAAVSKATTTSVEVTVPQGATTGKISLTANGATVTSTKDFVVALPLAIINFTPASAAIGEEVTITGTGFSTIPTNNIVQFNGTNATVVSATDTKIVAKVPQGVTDGKITVTVNGKTVTSANDFILSNTPTGLPATLTQGKLELYPNPLKDVLHMKISGNVNAQKVTISLYNLQGQLVKVFTQTMKDGRLNIGVKELPAGTYTAHIRVNDENIARRLVKL